MYHTDFILVLNFSYLKRKQENKTRKNSILLAKTLILTTFLLYTKLKNYMSNYLHTILVIVLIKFRPITLKPCTLKL